MNIYVQTPRSEVIGPFATWRDVERAAESHDATADDCVDICETMPTGVVRVMDRDLYIAAVAHDHAPVVATCGACGESWDDGVSTGWTPAPAGRCPFEYSHDGGDDA